MANRSNNIWAKAAAGSPGTNIARAQQSRWTGVPNETIMFLVEDKIGSMLEGISDATGRNAAAQIQLALQKKQRVTRAVIRFRGTKCEGTTAPGLTRRGRAALP